MASVTKTGNGERGANDILHKQVAAYTGTECDDMGLWNVDKAIAELRVCDHLPSLEASPFMHIGFFLL